MCAPSIWVCTLVCVCEGEKRGLERGWRKTRNAKEGAWRSAVQPPRFCLTLFQIPPSWLSEGNKGALFTSRPPLVYPPSPSTPLLSPLAPPRPPFLHFSGCISVIFYSFALPPAPWLFGSEAKMGLWCVALEPLNCAGWPRQYSYLIYRLIFFFHSV